MSDGVERGIWRNGNMNLEVVNRYISIHEIEWHELKQES